MSMDDKQRREEKCREIFQQLRLQFSECFPDLEPSDLKLWDGSMPRLDWEWLGVRFQIRISENCSPREDFPLELEAELMSTGIVRMSRLKVVKAKYDDKDWSFVDKAVRRHTTPEGLMKSTLGKIVDDSFNQLRSARHKVRALENFVDAFYSYSHRSG